MAISTTVLINQVLPSDPSIIYVNVTIDGDYSGVVWLSLSRSSMVGPSLDGHIAAAVSSFLAAQEVVVSVAQMVLIWQVGLQQ